MSPALRHDSVIITSKSWKMLSRPSRGLKDSEHIQYFPLEGVLQLLPKADSDL